MRRIWVSPFSSLSRTGSISRFATRPLSTDLVYIARFSVAVTASADSPRARSFGFRYACSTSAAAPGRLVHTVSRSGDHCPSHPRSRVPASSGSSSRNGFPCSSGTTRESAGTSIIDPSGRPLGSLVASVATKYT
jgi:hypothetical protein